MKTALTYVDVPIVAYGVLFRSARRPSRGGEAHEEKEKEKDLLSTARSNSSRRSASGAQGARGAETQAGEQLEAHLTWKKRDEGIFSLKVLRGDINTLSLKVLDIK